MKQFDPSVRDAAPESHKAILAKFEEIAEVMASQSAQPIVWSPPGNPRLLLNHYLDILWWVHVSKFHELCRSLIDAVNRGEFIIYGLIGRSLIEHAAVMRYYFWHRLKPTVDQAVSAGAVTIGQIQLLVTELDKFLRGSRFDWEAFLVGDFDTLLNSKSSASATQQVNVLTCVQKWAKDTPSVTVLYDIFCDLVHPNVGSTLLVMKRWTRGVGFGGLDGEKLGQDLFFRTIAGLTSLFAEIQRYLNAMLLLQMHDDGPA